VDEKVIQKFYGLQTNTHERDVADEALTSGLNFLCKGSTVYRRDGYQNIGTLNGRVMWVGTFDRLVDDDKLLVAFTPTDGYVMNTSGTFEFITRIYTTGTAQCSGGTTVTGTDTSWDYENYPDDSWYIKFGTTDPNGTGTPDTWYKIASWTSATALELDEDGPSMGSADDYVIRRCFTGATSDIFSVTFPVNSSAWTNALVVTNGVDPVMSYTGDTDEYLEAISYLETNSITAKYVTFYGEQLILAHLNDAGTIHEQGIMYSKAGDMTTWDEGAAGSEDLFGTQDQIMGIYSLADRLIVYKKYSITSGVSTGDDTLPFSFSQGAVRDIGLAAPRAIVSMNRQHYFLGWDNVYMYDGIRCQEVGDIIKDGIFDALNSEYIHYCFMGIVGDERAIALHIPTGDSSTIDKVYVVYDNKWNEWEYADSMTALGRYWETSAETFASLDESILYSTVSGRYVDWISISERYDAVYGDEDGEIYVYGTSTIDDDTDIDAYIITKDFSFYGFGKSFGLNRVGLGLEGENSASVKVYVSTDHGATWSTPITLDKGTGEVYVQRTAQFMESAGYAMIKVANVSGDDLGVEHMRFEYYPDGTSEWQ